MVFYILCLIFKQNLINNWYSRNFLIKYSNRSFSLQLKIIALNLKYWPKKLLKNINLIHFYTLYTFILLILLYTNCISIQFYYTKLKKKHMDC